MDIDLTNPIRLDDPLMRGIFVWKKAIFESTTAGLKRGFHDLTRRKFQIINNGAVDAVLRSTEYNSRGAYRFVNTGSTAVRFDTTANVEHNIGAGDFTWICTGQRYSDTGGPFQGMMSNGNFIPAMYMEVSGNDNIGFHWFSTTNGTVEWPIDGLFHMISARRIGTEVSLFFDGLLDVSVTKTNSMANGILRIGSSSTTNVHHSDASISNVIVYNTRGLPDSQMYEMYKAWKSGFKDQLNFIESPLFAPTAVGSSTNKLATMHTIDRGIGQLAAARIGGVLQ